MSMKLLKQLVKIFIRQENTIKTGMQAYNLDGRNISKGIQLGRWENRLLDKQALLY